MKRPIPSRENGELRPVRRACPATQGIDSRYLEYLEEKGWGKRTVSYQVRDWLISRQRYWGAPIPMIYCDKCGIVPVPEKDLPVLLPEDAEFRPTGESPLKYQREIREYHLPQMRRAGQTRDGYHGHLHVLLAGTSCAMPAPITLKRPSTRKRSSTGCRSTIYTGGAEHAVMHLFYARFFTKAIRDMGLIDFGEPFTEAVQPGHHHCATTRR